MPRTARTVIPGLPHHIIIRGNNRRRLFSYATDYRRFLWFLARAIKGTGAFLHALALLANHIHLLVAPRDAAVLALFVKSTAQRYAQVRNRRRDSSGKLFEERYRCIPIRSDEQLAAATMYVDLNAFRAGLVDDPAAHAWSTYRLHAGLPGSSVPASLWTPSPWYLTLGATPEARAVAYRDLVTARARECRPAPADPAKPQPAPRRYTLRLERPDRTRAAEATPPAWPCPGQRLLLARSAPTHDHKTRGRGK